MEILQPRKRAFKIALVNAGAILTAAVAAALVSGAISQNRIATTQEQILKEVTRRSQLSDVQDERMRRAICVLLRREVNQTPDIRAARTTMRCQ